MLAELSPGGKTRSHPIFLTTSFDPKDNKKIHVVLLFKIRNVKRTKAKSNKFSEAENSRNLRRIIENKVCLFCKSDSTYIGSSRAFTLFHCYKYNKPRL